MIRDFEKTKKQLAELAEVVNKFKSESVQLKVVEMLFGTSVQEADTDHTTDSEKDVPRKRSKKKRATPKKATNTKKSTKARNHSSSLGPVTALNKLYEEGFFSKARSINDICKHSDVHLAKKIKPNEISGKLGRMVRNGELSRSKNSDNQYEYTKP